MLLKLLKEAKVPEKIIEIIKIVFSKSWISFGKKSMWRSTRGLLQGSCLSQILSNFYINLMLRKLEESRSWVRAYADDIVIVVEDRKEIDSKLKIVIYWCKNYEINLNLEKSGIMRILKRSGKVQVMANVANIPEVTEYKYLGLVINQSLNFKSICSKIKMKLAYQRLHLRKISNSDLKPKARKLLLKTICYQFITYGCTLMYTISNKYKKCLNSEMYQFTKQIFGFKGNPKKEELYQILNLPNTDELIRRRMEGINQEKKRNAQVALSKKFQTPKIINFVIDSIVAVYKWKNKKWKCGIIVNQKHLIYECPEMDDWRTDVVKNLKVREIDELLKGLYINS